MTDLKYEAARNKLIPQAERFANERAGKQPAYLQPREQWVKIWDTIFLKKMDELAREQGLIK